MPSDRWDAREREYRETVRTVVLKPEPHTKREDPKVTGKRLYAITGISTTGSHVVVVCDDFDRAREIVETNEYDIMDNYYSLMVITTTLANTVCLHLNEDYWYVWQGELADGKYVPIEVPRLYQNSVGIGVG